MRRLLLPMLAVLCLMAWASAFLLLRAKSNAIEISIPTLMVLPSVTPTQMPSSTLPPTLTATFTATATVAPTETPLPTQIPTLSERVLEFTVIMPGVVLPPVPTDFPYGTVLLPAPPQPIEPLPDATESALRTSTVTTAAIPTLTPASLPIVTWLPVFSDSFPSLDMLAWSFSGNGWGV